MVVVVNTLTTVDSLAMRRSRLVLMAIQILIALAMWQFHGKVANKWMLRPTQS